MTKDDFFEDEPKAKGSKSKKDSKKGVTGQQKGSANKSYMMNLYLAIALIVGALVVGIFAGHYVWPSTESSIPTTSTPMEAPPLTQEQMQQGQMPAGHPPVTSPETSTPSGTDSTPPETTTTP